ncbi:Chaperone protein Skp [Vibrio stylophorae]|uniref:Chaperone protein skp n=1 Tax=Vibrio stylophorae TaxID=659351 RepID=A0ABN8DTY5_9VIBR|nr:OmpH family outer membrane protein [Vibrio stylophorae]CAH0534227.1 Chaperone protein Skp [Vibrio stylophorae]
MKQSIKALGLGLVFALSSVFSVSASAAEKVGYVNLGAVMQQLPQREAIGKKLQGEFKDRINELKRIQEKAQKKVEKFKRDGELMSSDDRIALQREIAELESDYRLKAKALKEDSDRREREENMKLMKQIGEAVKKVATAQGYDMVVDAQALLYATDGDDLSAKVIAEMKK